MLGRSKKSALAVALGILGGAGLIASCTPPPSGPAPQPQAPVISRFAAATPRTQAPVVATLGWTVRDANHDDLTCRVDVDGDGTFDRVIQNCTSTSTVLAEFKTAGQRSLTLEVSDGNFAPVTATTSLDVTEAPDEDYEITLRLDASMRPEFREAFENAAQRWEQVVTAGVPDEYLDLPINPFGFPSYVGVVDDVLIDARDVPMDGAGGLLGRAGGFAVRSGNWQPYYGIMEFDSADLERLASRGSLDSVILHEMGHVLGLGASWVLTGQITDLLTEPHYIGVAANAAYQQIGGTGLIPVETEGEFGTVLGHWKESVFDDELMTGYLGAGSEPLSIVTIGALVDQGYGVDLSAADPYILPALRNPANRSRSAATGAENLEVQPIAAGIVS